MEMMKETVKTNLISGFRKCGIYPTDKEELLKRLSDKRKHVEVNFTGDRFLEVPESKRGHAANVKTTKRKKINVPPGKGITLDALRGCELIDISNEPVDYSSNSACSINVSSQCRRNRSLTKCRIQALSSSESSSDEEFSCDDETSDESFESFDENVPSVEDADRSTENSASHVELIESNNNYKVGDHVIVLYTGDGLHYPGKIVQIGKQFAVKRCMEKADGVSGSWRWPRDRMSCPMNGSLSLNEFQPLRQLLGETCIL